MKSVIRTILISAYGIIISHISAYASTDQGIVEIQKEDYKAAYKEFLPDAEKGDVIAQFFMGTFFDNGQGVKQDYKAAAKWYRRAAEQGYPLAQSNLGSMHSGGQGVEQNFAEAMKWFHLAAEQGEIHAQLNLGFMYANGQGVLKDDTYAHMWFNIAGLSGDKTGIGYRDKIAKRMTPEQITKAEEHAREWVSNHP